MISRLQFFAFASYFASAFGIQSAATGFRASAAIDVICEVLDDQVAGLKMAAVSTIRDVKHYWARLIFLYKFSEACPGISKLQKRARTT